MICMFKVVNYCQLINSATFGICALKYMGLILLISFCKQISMGSSLRKHKNKIIFFCWYQCFINGRKRYQRRNMSCYIHRYAKVNNKYMQDNDKIKESSYLNQWDVNNLYRWAISQNLPADGISGLEKHLNEDSDIGYFFEVDV